MSQFAAINVDDTNSSPVNFDFRPVSLVNGIATWCGDSTAFLEVVDRPQVTLSMRPGKMGSPNNYGLRTKRKVVMKISIPFQTSTTVVDTGNPVYDTVDLELTVAAPVDCPAQAITDALGFLVQISDDSAQYRDAIIDGEFVY
jgi:hypothetical protein